MHSIDEHLTEIYVFIDDYFKAHPQRAHWRQSNNAAPDFTDAEVITIALMQGYFGGATLRRTYALVKANAPAAFPHLCGYKRWLARLHQLTSLVGQLLEAARRSCRVGRTLFARLQALATVFELAARPRPFVARGGRLLRQNE